MNNIVVFAETPLYGASRFLVKGIRKGYNVTLCCWDRKSYVYETESERILYWTDSDESKKRICKLISTCDKLIVVASVSLRRFLMNRIMKHKFWNGFTNLRHKHIRLIITDSHYCNNSDYFNRLFRENEMVIYMMPDLYQFCDSDIKVFPYYPSVEIPKKLIMPKKSSFIVSHMPGIKFDLNLKGTREIIKVLDRLKKEIPNIISYIDKKNNWEECIRIKSKSYIFIDQLIKGNPNIDQNRFGSVIYEGGLGKSGIESMALGTLTITSGTPIDTSRYFPPPPVIWVDFNSIVGVLREHLNDRSKSDLIAEEQKDWAQKFANPEFVAKYVLGDQK